MKRYRKGYWLIYAGYGWNEDTMSHFGLFKEREEAKATARQLKQEGKRVEMVKLYMNELKEGNFKGVS
jgi:hypothetical protein